MFIEICLVFTILLLFWRFRTKPSNYPPGPWGLPFVGYISFSKKNLEEQIIDICKENGNCPLVSWRMGIQNVVFILDSRCIKEAFSHRDFADRPPMRGLGFVGGSSIGIVLGNGAQWKNTRRFSLHHLKNLGMGKSDFVSVIQHEAEELMHAFKSRTGKADVIPVHHIVASILNVTWQLTANKRYSYDNKDLHSFVTSLEEFRANMNGITIMDFMPWLKYLLPDFLKRIILDQELVEKFSAATLDFVKIDIEEHKKAFKEHDSVNEDYIDAYLAELKKNENNPDSTFSMDDLIISITDLFGAGIETVVTTYQWVIFYLAKYPLVQRRLQEEVDKALPKGTLATLEDRVNLPYTEAVYNEVLRYTALARLGVMRMAASDTTLAGYNIPKGTVIASAIFRANFDPKYWDSPEKFSPERFLDKDGKFVLPKYFFPFGAGKRACIGEALARMELMIFVSALAQSVNISVPEGKTLDLTEYPSRFFSSPKLYQELLMTLR